ncbi:MAG: orotate phosphoribosyltransferase [Burkholderiales bacterium]|nr:orotate phosphoribosyltransferase [Burkholderiales bacterium]
MSALSREFIAFAVACEAIRFGSFRTKAGRESPYFLNTGVFDDGERLYTLAQFYAKAIVASGLPFDMLFGAAYKGIPLVAGVAIALAAGGRNVPFCFNRKEAKDHGEGGLTVGAPLAGRVLIVDDVISAGTSVRTAIDLIRRAHAEPCGLVVSLDRMERGTGELSAIQEVTRSFDMPAIAIANLDDLIRFVRSQQSLEQYLHPIARYREQYGVGGDEGS